MNLHPQGQKGDEVDTTESAEKEPTRQVERRSLGVCSPKPARQGREKRTVLCNKTVDSFGHVGETGQTVIAPKERTFVQSAQDSLCPAQNRSVLEN